MIASTFNTYFRHSNEVRLVDMTGLMEFAGIWKRREQVFASPAYYVFKMYADVKGHTVLPVTADFGTYRVQNGTVGFPEVDNVPYIDVTATLSQDKKHLTVFCVNRSLSEDVPTRIALDSFNSSQKAIVTQLYAISRYVMNDEVEPNRVTPLVSSIDISGTQQPQVVLPHDSVTVIRFQAR